MYVTERERERERIILTHMLYITHTQCCQFSDFVARFSYFPIPFETFFKSLGTHITTSWTNLI